MSEKSGREATHDFLRAVKLRGPVSMDWTQMDLMASYITAMQEVVEAAHQLFMAKDNYEIMQDYRRDDLRPEHPLRQALHNLEELGYMDADGNMTGREIIHNVGYADYLHLSPPFVRELVEYVGALETAITEARKFMHPAGGPCEGYDDQWCPTSCKWWKVCEALEGE